MGNRGTPRAARGSGSELQTGEHRVELRLSPDAPPSSDSVAKWAIRAIVDRDGAAEERWQTPFQVVSAAPAIAPDELESEHVKGESCEVEIKLAAAGAPLGGTITGTLAINAPRRGPRSQDHRLPVPRPPLAPHREDVRRPHAGLEDARGGSQGGRPAGRGHPGAAVLALFASGRRANRNRGQPLGVLVGRDVDRLRLERTLQRAGAPRGGALQR
jgi:hypothetical protein